MVHQSKISDRFKTAPLLLLTLGTRTVRVIALKQEQNEENVERKRSLAMCLKFNTF